MSNFAKYIIGILVTAVVLFLVWYFSNIVAYILISAVLAIIGKPMVDNLTKIRIKQWCVPRWLASLVTLATMWTVLILFFTFFIPLVYNKLNQLSTLDVGFVVSTFEQPLHSFQEFLQRVFGIRPDDFSIVDEISRQVNTLLDYGFFNRLLSSTLSVVVSTGIALFSITFITFFFLKQDNLFQNMVISVFPKKYESNIRHALESVTRLLIRYFTGILTESSIIILILSCAFMIWGFDANTAFFMGFIMGLLNVIPYIGPIMGTIICIIVGIISPLPGATMLYMTLLVGSTILCVQAIDNFILQPLLYSSSVNAHPLEIFLVILIAGSVGGILGMLLAIPTYTVIRVFAKEFFNNFYLVQKLTEKI